MPSKGFSLVEMLVTLSLMLILTLIITSAFSKFKKSQSVDKGTNQVISLIQKARYETLSAKNNVAYGVHFDANQAVLYSQAYNASSTSNEKFALDPYITISQVTLNGGGSDMLFIKFSGETNAYGTVIVSLASASTTKKTITVYQSGLVDSN
jgi:prepilin-type N-terminal cleavage/methylation domain-containing protein